jgi:GT2 family glycosyltransferase
MAIRIDVLIPTRDRPTELATTLAGLAAQGGPRLRVTVSDQSHGRPAFDTPASLAMIRRLTLDGHEVRLVRHLPRRGMAEHRAFLLARARAEHVLFLDDDVWLEPGAVQRLHRALGRLQCGFVGYAPQALSHRHDRRPDELALYQEWPRRPDPEQVRPDSPLWRRWALHNAANLVHLAADLDLEPDEWRAYRVAWVDGCVLYDRAALVAAGGFDFWPRLPREHTGEQALAQVRIMAGRGGAGILPSGAVHLEPPPGATDRGRPLVNALALLDLADEHGSTDRPSDRSSATRTTAAGTAPPT